MTQPSESSEQAYEHGGDIYTFAKEHGLSERAVIDFSSNINPIGVSRKARAAIRKDIKRLQFYPDNNTSRLKNAISKHYSIRPDTILCGNGSTELIYLIPRAFKPDKVLIASPTFSEYERASSIAGSAVITLGLKEDEDFNLNPEGFIDALEDCDMAFLCNPNNPTGRLLRLEGTMRIIDGADKKGVLLIIDEAFIDLQSAHSVIAEAAQRDNLIVLRAFTKFFALAGLRVGYLVSNTAIIERLKAIKEPWTVNSLAQTAAVASLSDRAYFRETMEVIEAEKRYLLNELFRIKYIRVFPSDTNFFLLKTPPSLDVVTRLSGMGILVRDCSNFHGLDKGFIRIAIKRHEENVKLIKALKQIEV